MPILSPSLRPKLPELGRIRTGDQVATKSGGTRPNKLEQFRLTSPHEDLLQAAAGLYGGTVRPWKNDRAKPTDQFELYTDVDEFPIILPYGAEFDQWYERWDKAGCNHRCDGYNDTITKALCDLGCGEYDPETRQSLLEVSPSRYQQVKDQAKAEAIARREKAGVKTTTRVSVCLTDLPGFGSWRLESHGHYASEEILGAMKGIEHLGNIPGVLKLEARTRTKVGFEGNGKRKDEKLNWIVPVLIFSHSIGQLVSQQTAAIEGAQQYMLEGEKKAIEGARDAHLHEPSSFDETTPYDFDATDEQKQEILRLAKALNVSDAQLRDVLAKDRMSMDNLSDSQAIAVIDRMTKKLAEVGA